MTFWAWISVRSRNTRVTWLGVIFRPRNGRRRPPPNPGPKSNTNSNANPNPWTENSLSVQMENISKAAFP